MSDTLLLLTAYAIVRTVPSAIGQIGGKKKSHLPLAMGIVHISVRRMASERKTQLTDALVRILSRFLTPATISMDGAHDS